MAACSRVESLMRRADAMAAQVGADLAELTVEACSMHPALRRAVMIGRALEARDIAVELSRTPTKLAPGMSRAEVMAVLAGEARIWVGMMDAAQFLGVATISLSRIVADVAAGRKPRTRLRIRPFQTEPTPRWLVSDIRDELSAVHVRR